MQHFYEETHGSGWESNQGWKVYGPVGDPCTDAGHYSGVGCKHPCDEAIEGANCQLGRITRLALEGNSLSGTLPPSLSTLDMLTELDLSRNRLSGTLPTELGLLRKLVRFNLRDNWISGTIPTELGNLGSYLWLGTTKFDVMAGGLEESYATRPSEVSEPLIEVRLGHNQLSGAMPTQLG